MSGILGKDKLGAFTLGSASGLWLILNRTQEDVDRAEELAAIPYANMTDDEKAEWTGNLKGAYNASDLNRVETAVDFLASELRALPVELLEYAASKGVAWDAFFYVPYNAADYNLRIKTDWQTKDIQTPAEMERYLSNVKTLRNALNYSTDSLPTSMNYLRWQGANVIERALDGLDAAIKDLRAKTKDKIDRTAAWWIYTGEIYAGEV